MIHFQTESSFVEIYIASKAWEAIIVDMVAWTAHEITFIAFFFHMSHYRMMNTDINTCIVHTEPYTILPRNHVFRQN